MKIRVDAKAIANGINTVIKAVPARSTMPILECILMKANGNQLELTGNDTNLGIRTVIDAEVEEPGIIAVEAKILNDIISKAASDEIIIEADTKNYSVKIVSGRAKFNIGGIDPDSFTELPEINVANYIEVEQCDLRTLIQGTIFAVSADGSNKIMTGELFWLKDGILKVVALDGHRVAIRNLKIENQESEWKVIVPGKAVSDISKLLDKNAGSKIKIGVTRNHIMFSFENTVIISLLIDGEYFDVDRVLYNDFKTTVNISRIELMDVVGRSFLFTKDNNKKPIIMDIGDDVLSFSITSNIGKMDDEIEGEVTGDKFAIGFNPYYLMDAIKTIESDTVSMNMLGKKHPCIIKDENETYLYVILPVNF